MSATHTEQTLLSDNNLKLYMQSWTPTNSAVRAELLVVHGYGEYGGRYRELAHALIEGGIRSSAVDLRGQGRSEGRRGFVRRFDDYLADIALALDALPKGKRFMLGHSNGGLAALAFAAAAPDKLDGLVITNPYLALRMPVPAPKRIAGNVAARLWPTLSMPSGLEGKLLTHDAAIIDAWERDPLITHVATARWFAESTRVQAEVRALRALEVPLLFVYSDADPITSPEASAALIEQLQVRDKTVLVRPGELHEVLNETDRQSLFDAIRSWIVERS